MAPAPAHYTPNHIPRGKRIVNVVLSLLVIGYATVGLVRDDMVIPVRRGPPVHLHGTAAWLLAAACLCAIANLLAVVIDHYDRRYNEHHYEAIAWITQALGWVLVVLAGLADVGR